MNTTIATRLAEINAILEKISPEPEYDTYLVDTGSLPTLLRLEFKLSKAYLKRLSVGTLIDEITHALAQRCSTVRGQTRLRADGSRFVQLYLSLLEGKEENG